MKIYEKRSLIKCSIEELFCFHLDMNNLKAITPNNVKVTLLNEGFIPKEGEVLKLRTVKNFIPIHWEVKIEKLSSPNLLVDVAMKSPFKSWKHSHIFSEVEPGLCEMRDVVEYSLPFWIFNSLLDFIVKFELESMFKHRHNVTKNILESTS